MKKIVKQVAGVDVSKDELVVCLGRMFDDLNQELFAGKRFVNSKKGFEQLVRWVDKECGNDSAVRFVMEATGVYHEGLAYYLAEQNRSVSIVLPNKISNYMRTLEVKTITDKTSSEAIARFGLERKLTDWKRPDPVYKTLKQLTRERSQIIEMRTGVKNQLHAERAGAMPNPAAVSRFNKHISFLNKQEKEINQEINALISENEQVREAVGYLCSIGGVGTLTVVTVLAETTGFDLIRNKKQLVSFSGLDVIDKQSGTSVKAKPRISKRGNRHLRKAMHMPALSAIKCDPRYKEMYERLLSRHGIKMKAVVAVQRKLLELMYTLFKNKTMYDPNYQDKKIEESTH